MNALPFVILALVLSFGTQVPAKKDPPPSPPAKAVPQPQPKLQPVVDVEIVVATHPKLLEACKNTNKPPRTIYVDVNSKQVFHCVGKKVLVPHTDHGPGHELSEADVLLSEGQRVRWFSTTHTFWVRPVVKGKQAPQNPKAPPTPFPPSFSFSKVPASEVISAPVESVGGAEVVVQRYKITFDITGLGVVDPDLICSM